MLVFLQPPAQAMESGKKLWFLVTQHPAEPLQHHPQLLLVSRASSLGDEGEGGGCWRGNEAVWSHGAPRWQHKPPAYPVLSPLLPQSAQHVTCPPLSGLFGKLQTTSAGKRGLYSWRREEKKEKGLEHLKYHEYGQCRWPHPHPPLQLHWSRYVYIHTHVIINFIVMLHAHPPLIHTVMQTHSDTWALQASQTGWDTPPFQGLLQKSCHQTLKNSDHPSVSIPFLPLLAQVQILFGDPHFPPTPGSRIAPSTAQVRAGVWNLQYVGLVPKLSPTILFHT